MGRGKGNEDADGENRRSGKLPIVFNDGMMFLRWVDDGLFPEHFFQQLRVNVPRDL
jgi:hypothetical protein